MHSSTVWNVEKEATSRRAPVLYHYRGVWSTIEGWRVDVLFRNKRATVSLVYIGLYGSDGLLLVQLGETNPEAKAFTF